MEKLHLIYKNKKVGHIHAESYFKINKKSYCKSVFKTNSINHPAVKKIYDTKNLFVGGKLFFMTKKLLKINILFLTKKKNFITILFFLQEIFVI